MYLLLASKVVFVLFHVRLDLVKLPVQLNLWPFIGVLNLVNLISVQNATVLHLFRLLVRHVHIDNTASNLELPEHTWEYFTLFSNKHECTKLAQVVFEVEITVIELDLRVVTWDWDVSNANLLVHASTNFESLVAQQWHEDLNHATCGLFKGKTF